MTGAELAMIVQGLQTAITLAPSVVAVGQKAAELIDALGDADAITLAEHQALSNHIAAVMEAVLNHEEPPHWKVEPDPGPANGQPPTSDVGAG